MRSQRVTSRQRQAVEQRANNCCEYCRSQAQYSPDPFSVEHIRPKARGGTTTLDNLAFSCQGCNGAKYAKMEGQDTQTSTTVTLFHPRQQLWSNHFVWNEDYTQVVGLTPTGRATIETLHLNRQNVVNFRRVLYADGKHPPTDE